MDGDIVERLRQFQAADETTYSAAWIMSDAADEIMRLRQVVLAALRWRQYNPEKIPAVVPQSMNITTRVALMRAIDDYLDKVASR